LDTTVICGLVQEYVILTYGVKRARLLSEQNKISIELSRLFSDDPRISVYSFGNVKFECFIYIEIQA